MTREQALRDLHQIARRIVEVLGPWGFEFAVQEVGHGHTSFANGVCHRGSASIGLFYRSGPGLAEPTYQWGRARTGHQSLMWATGHGDDCQLLVAGPTCRSRGGGDPIDALLHDLGLQESLLRLDLDAQVVPNCRVITWRSHPGPRFVVPTFASAMSRPASS